ncbi:D-amino-acid transaminase [Blastochloris viridis]|uniref:Probable branched-chain-amino-acid aminotransferase n=1 Tax=Blastochloris viridis TaxID=1079 RepID=A0A0H5BE01_BLAVI|nr:D-amino-acid transaminase [Blastochloris viridis]ALK09687.1 D-alanine aminotransferase [Blastochloris viridis]BAS00423.1 D-alanine aminotransferase [Blastochloris viridis]CUU42350.1 D-alanine aminotransferase [Blastochloris viridis]
MSRIAYVNGLYVPHGEAGVHIEDRGFQFADGVYEVCEVRDGHLIDETRHISRLIRSLGELRMAMPMSRAALGLVLREVVRRNRVRDGLVYLQVTRGVAQRNFLFPANTTPTLVVTARATSRAELEQRAEAGISVITVPDNRWDRVDIKTVGLLPNCLAKEAAKAAGAREAWFVDRDGYVTEGGSSNAWIVSAEGRLITRPAEFGILRGITRTVTLEVAARLNLQVEERGFTREEAYAAVEAFVTSATLGVMPVVRIDGRAVGDGKPGRAARELRATFHSVAEVAP